MNESTEYDVPSAARDDRTDDGTVGDLTASMAAVARLAAKVLDEVPAGVDVVVTRDSPNEIVLAYEVARLRGCERAIVQEDLGLMSVSGPGLGGAKVVLLAIGRPAMGFSPLTGAVESAGGEIVETVVAGADG